MMNTRELIERLEAFEDELPEPTDNVFYLGFQQFALNADQAITMCLQGQMVLLSRGVFRQLVQAMRRAECAETLRSIGAEGE